MTRHRHAAPALVIGVDGPLRFLGSRTHESRAALVAPGFAHAVDTRGGRLALFVLPPHTVAADRVRPVSDVPKPLDWVARGEAVFAGALVDFAEIDHACARGGMLGCPIDPRLRAAIRSLGESLDENVSIDDLALGVRLSPARLMNLARAQLGVPLRAFRRWLRAFEVARAYAKGASLTEAAHAAGFASSAHLSMAAREHFGIRPSDILSPGNRAAIRTL